MMNIVIAAFFVLTGCTGKSDALIAADSITPEEKTLAGKFSYTLGKETKSIDLKTLSVSINKETIDDGNGNTKSNSTLDFTVHDFDSKLSFRFHIKDENLVSEFKGEYSLNSQVGYGDGDPVRFTNIMIVNTQDASKSYFSFAGESCNVNLKGEALTVEIKNASVRQGEEIVQFSLRLQMDGVKVRNKLDQ